MGKVYLEHLYHFSCPYCKKWFSIGDSLQSPKWICPSCGETFLVDYKEILGMTPGWKTSEFWLTMMVQLIAILTVTEFLTADEALVIKGQLTQVVILGAPFVVAAVSMIMYIYSRMKIKINFGKTNFTSFEDLVEVAKEVNFVQKD